CGRLGDPPGTWPQARARAPGAVHRARERPRAIVLRAMGDLPSFRAVRWMVPESGSRKKVDLSLAIGFGYSERAAELKVGEGIEHAGSKRWLLGRAGSGGGLGQSRPRGPADARDPPERAHAHAHPRRVVGCPGGHLSSARPRRPRVSSELRRDLGDGVGGASPRRLRPAG